MKIDELLLVTDHIKPEILRRVKDVARSRGTRVRKLNVTLEETERRENMPAFVGPAYREQTLAR